jgi:hypothetical protein
MTMTDVTGGNTGGDAAAAAAAAVAAAASAAKPWYDGKVDADQVTYLTNKGWHNKDVATVALEASRAHRELEKHIGVPANELIRLPKTPTAPEWKDVYTKLGAPADPAAYKFDGIKMGDADLEPALQDFFRKTATDLHLTVDGAKQLAAAVVKQIGADVDASKADMTAKIANEKTALAKNWGANDAVNRVVAQNAAKALGVDAEVLNALESTMGYAKTMEMFRQIGEKIGEDKFVRGSARIGDSSIMTTDQASEKKAALLKDTAWTQRYMNGDVTAQKEMLALNTILVEAGRA